MKAYSFDIDIVGACNLRCPSCAQGNVKEYRLPHGQMEPQLLREILAKAKKECRVTSVQLFVWGSPLLHSRLPEMIRIVNEAGLPCNLSSNLNVRHDADAIMAANPASFKISMSGFTQEVYGITHCGGDVERVKRHMKELAEAKARQGAATRIYVCFHRYRHNLKEEPLLREFAARLGIGFEPIWAQLLPVCKVLRFVDDTAFDFALTAADRQLIEHLALPLGKALELAQRYRHQPCPLRDRQYSIDWQGNAWLCCAGFDARRFTIGPFLEMPLARIQELRENHANCTLCMSHGAHVYMTYGAPGLDELALANLDPEDVELLDLRYEIAARRMKRRIDTFYRRLPVQLSPAAEAALVRQVNRAQGLMARIRHALGGSRNAGDSKE
jgi:organic radical activating enzyme